jgi:hypothetical protein
MKKVKLENGAYKLVADDNKILKCVAEDGTAIYADSVTIPTGQTALTWQEVDAAEKPKPAETIEEENLSKIAELEKQLAELKGEEV